MLAFFVVFFDYSFIKEEWLHNWLNFSQSGKQKCFLLWSPHSGVFFACYFHKKRKNQSLSVSNLQKVINLPLSLLIQRFPFLKICILMLLLSRRDWPCQFHFAFYFVTFTSINEACIFFHSQNFSFCIIISYLHLLKMMRISLLPCISCLMIWILEDCISLFLFNKKINPFMFSFIQICFYLINI